MLVESLWLAHDAWLFVRRWLSAPRIVGAIAPSSTALARAMLAAAGPLDGPVLEVGAGTGVFTRALLDAGVRPGALQVVERLPEFAAMLRERHPEVDVIEADAAELRPARLPVPASIVISGLPFRAMPAAQVDRIVSAVLACTAHDVRLVQFSYGLRCPIPSATLQRLGLVATRMGFVARNLPPAFVWRIGRRRADAIEVDAIGVDAPSAATGTTAAALAPRGLHPHRPTATVPGTIDGRGAGAPCPFRFRST
jgi:phospholipid N-methyltransferase